MEQMTATQGNHYVLLMKWDTYPVVEEIRIEKLKKIQLSRKSNFDDVFGSDHYIKEKHVL